MNNLETDNKYQMVYIELNDGRIGSFCGPVFLTEEDIKKNELIIKNVSFGTEQKLPSGIYWSDLTKDVAVVKHDLRSVHPD